MPLGAMLLQAVGGSERAHLPAQLQVKAIVQSGQKSAAKCIANPGRIDDLLRLHAGNLLQPLIGMDFEPLFCQA